MLRTSVPVRSAVDAADAAQHCITDDPGDLVLLGRLAEAATRLVETETARSFRDAEWTLTLDAFPPVIELRVCPVRSVESVRYFDAAGEQQTLDPEAYIVDTASEPGRITRAPGTSWPQTQRRVNAVEVTFVAGYGRPTEDDEEGEDDCPPHDIPAAATQAILLLVGHWFANREAVGNVGGEIALTYRALVNSLKWTW